MTLNLKNTVGSRIFTHTLLFFLLVFLCFVNPFANANELTQVNYKRGLKVGVGDRLLWYNNGKKQSTVQTLNYMDIYSDMLAIWLPRDWQKSWIDRKELDLMTQQDITPVFIHYFYGDIISKERILASQEDWLASIRRMAKLVKSDTPVLIVLEPEFNHDAPEGETSVLLWEGFSDHIEKGLRIIREEAPNALVAICPGDFSPARNLEISLGKIAPKLDFLAFQEMRATTDPDRSFFAYKDVGNAAVSYSKYLQDTFNKPILLAYIALSSYGGWEKKQAKMLYSVINDEQKLLNNGVFGALYFQLLDDPLHEGYFGKAEKNFGLIDLNGEPKPAAYVYKDWANKKKRVVPSASAPE